MYVRVLHGRFTPDRYDDVLRLTQEQLIPALRRLPGFRAYHGGVDRTAGKLVALSFWDSAEQAQAIAAQRGSFEALGVQFEAPETYEIVVQA